MRTSNAFVLNGMSEVFLSYLGILGGGDSNLMYFVFHLVVKHLNSTGAALLSCTVE